MFMGRIHIVKKGVTKLDVDCVVNAANEGLLPGGGVCGAIFKEAGYDKLEKACSEIGHCDTGDAVITSGFNLKAKYIVHAVGPRWGGGKNNEASLLYSCYQKAILLAEENGCESIGFPLISSGIFGYPKKEAWEVALKAVEESTYQSDMEVYFAVLDDEMLKLGQQVYDFLFGNSDDAILKSVDRSKLHKCIEDLCRIRKIEWSPSKVQGKTEDGKDILTLPYPIYPPEIFEVFELLKPDYQYTDNIKKFPDGLLATDMTVDQIRTMLTYIERGERFCDGSIAAEVENGRLLKILLRLDDLLTNYLNE